MGYQLRTRWLEGFPPMPDIESLKRQIDVVKREIARRESELDNPPRTGMTADAINDLSAFRLVLATLERMMPPF